MLSKQHFGRWLAGATPVLALTLLLVGCNGSSPTTSGSPTAASNMCVSGTLNVAGSTALQPLAQQAAQDYMAQCSGATINVGGGGSKTGLAEVEGGQVDIGDSDIFGLQADPSNPNKYSDLVDHQVAVVIFTLVTNNDVTVANLTTQQIQDIYTGKTTNWSQVGGNNEAIVVVNRPASSGTRATFKKYVLNGATEAAGKTLTQDSTSAVISAVSTTPGAIGYVTVGFLKQYQGKVKEVSIDGNAPTETNVDTNAYKFWNIEHMYTKGQPSGLAASFLTFMKSTQVVQTDEPALSFFNISNLSPDALASHTPQ